MEGVDVRPLDLDRAVGELEPGRWLIALTMLKTLPARSTAASYSSASSPSASLSWISRMYANAYLVCGKPRSTLLVAGSGQRLVTAFVRV